MTNEEAIGILIKRENASLLQGAEALMIAITALENQSKYEKALRQVCDEQLGIGLYRTKEDRDKAASEIAKGYKQWAGIKE